MSDSKCLKPSLAYKSYKYTQDMPHECIYAQFDSGSRTPLTCFPVAVMAIDAAQECHVLHG